MKVEIMPWKRLSSKDSESSCKQRMVRETHVFPRAVSYHHAAMTLTPALLSTSGFTMVHHV